MAVFTACLMAQNYRYCPRLCWHPHIISQGKKILSKREGHLIRACFSRMKGTMMHNSNLEKTQPTLRERIGMLRKRPGQQPDLWATQHRHLQFIDGLKILHSLPFHWRLCTVSVHTLSVQLVGKYQINACFYSIPSLDMLLNECSLCEEQELWECMITILTFFFPYWTIFAWYAQMANGHQAGAMSSHCEQQATPRQLPFTMT